MEETQRSRCAQCNVRSVEKHVCLMTTDHAWRIPWIEEPGGLQFIRSERNTVKEMDSHLLEHQDYDEEPAGRDMPFVLRQHVQRRQRQVWARMWRNQNPHTPLVGM